MSSKDTQNLSEDEFPAWLARCAYCGEPLTLETQEDKVLMWCKERCRMIWGEERVLKEDNNEH